VGDTSQRDRVYRHGRNSDGTWNLYNVELAEPHEYHGDVFTRQRVDTIMRETQQRYPVGALFIGHNGPRDEAPRIGQVTGYRRSPGGRILVDFERIEPAVFAEIAVGRWWGRSLEFEYPSFGVIEGVALLGSSRQFFDYPPLRVQLDPDEREQLRIDQEEWLAPAHRRATGARPSQRQHARQNGNTMAWKTHYRMAITDQGLTPQVARTRKGRAPKESQWRALRMGEAMPMGQDEEDLKYLRGSLDELHARVATLEDAYEDDSRKRGAPPVDEDEDATRADEDEDADVDIDVDAGGEDEEEEERKRRSRPRRKRRSQGGANEALRRVEEMEDRQHRREVEREVEAAIADGILINGAYRKTLTDTLVGQSRLGEDWQAHLADFCRQAARIPLAGVEEDVPDSEIDTVGAHFEDEEDLKAFRGFAAKLSAAQRTRAYSLCREARSALRRGATGSWSHTATPVTTYVRANLARSMLR